MGKRGDWALSLSFVFPIRCISQLPNPSLFMPDMQARFFLVLGGIYTLIYDGMCFPVLKSFTCLEFFLVGKVLQNNCLTV